MYTPSEQAHPLMSQLFEDNSDFFAYNGPDCCRVYGIGVFLGFQSNTFYLDVETLRIATLPLDKASSGINTLFYVPSSVLEQLATPPSMNAEIWRFVKEQSKRYVPPQQVVVACEFLEQDWILGKYLPY